MNFNTWLDTFVQEKNYDPDYIISVNGASGINYMPLQVILDTIKSAPKAEQQTIKTMLVSLDFQNGDCLDFFKYLGEAIAI